MDTASWHHGYSAPLADGGRVEVLKFNFDKGHKPYWAVFYYYSDGSSAMNHICEETNLTYSKAMSQAWSIINNAKEWCKS